MHYLTVIWSINQFLFLDCYLCIRLDYFQNLLSIPISLRICMIWILRNNSFCVLFVPNGSNLLQFPSQEILVGS